MPLDATAREIAEAVRSGRRSAEQICRETLADIEERDPAYSAFLERTSESALQRAAQIDSAVRGGTRVGALAGVPIAIKDNICTRAGHTTCGSRILQHYRSPFDATVIERIEAAGGVIVGKTNLDEFAMGSSTENSGFGPTRNPWNTDCVPGGSSGGSAAAVAAGLAALALGSDTGGSVRQPAALCGVVGLKPSYGRVSRYGLVAYGSSLDQIGPFARDVTDAALLLQVIAGRDASDSTSVSRAVDDYPAALADEPVSALGRTLRIGLPREFFAEGLDAEVRAAVEAALEVYRARGARVVEVGLPHALFSVAVYYLVATAEASSNLARYDGVHYGHRAADTGNILDLYSRSREQGFGPEVKRRIMLGTFALSAGYAEQYYLRALKVRRLIHRDFEAAFQQADVLISPTSPTAAFRFGEKTADPLQMYLADIYTIAANLAGVPAVSIPCGQTRSGLPIGMQIMAPAFEESRMLQAARLFERETDWHLRRPPIPRAR